MFLYSGIVILAIAISLNSMRSLAIIKQKKDTTEQKSEAKTLSNNRSLLLLDKFELASLVQIITQKILPENQSITIQIAQLDSSELIIYCSDAAAQNIQETVQTIDIQKLELPRNYITSDEIRINTSYNMLAHEIIIENKGHNNFKFLVKHFTTQPTPENSKISENHYTSNEITEKLRFISTHLNKKLRRAAEDYSSSEFSSSSSPSELSKD